MSTLTFETLPTAVATLLNEVKDLKKLIQGNNAPEIVETPEQLLTVNQAADFLSLSKATIYTKVNRGELPVMKQGKRLYFSDRELMEYLKAGRKKTYSEAESAADEYFTNSKKLK